jgi:SAM-dependent methyltransferase
MLEREYSTSKRLEARRTNVTGWLQGPVEAWDEALALVAEMRPQRVLDAGCGDGLFARLIAAPVVIGVDNAPAMVARAREYGVDAPLPTSRICPSPTTRSTSSPATGCSITCRISTAG